MATTYSRVSTSTDGSSYYTLYSNSASTVKRVLVTDIHFAADSGYYGSNMNSVTFSVVKRADSIASAMTSVVLHIYQSYPYSLYLNACGSHGAGSIIFSTNGNSPGANHPLMSQQSYANTPNGNMSYYQTVEYGGSQSNIGGMGQCVLYPGDTIRVGVNKVGTAYVNMLIISE